MVKEKLAEKKTVVNPTTLELGQLKYFAMLRYEGATVIEADVDTGVYHITYKPVSYTHLDVYKRQWMICCGISEI